MIQTHAGIRKKCHFRRFLSGIYPLDAQSGKDPQQKPSGMTSNYPTAHGFTLIELLVVVLIIGILAAIALPQYQFVIYKTRLVSGIPLAKAIQQAQDAYFLEHGDWATSFEELGFSFPQGCSSWWGWMRCGNTIYGLSKHGAWGKSAFVSAWVTLAQLGCPGGHGGYCGQIRFPYKGSYANWYYQHVDGVYCQATTGYTAGAGQEYAHRICRNLAGGKAPIASVEYPL